jgi:hypothetical protein
MDNTYYRTRSLYDCYKQYFGIQGIILDSDDIIADPHLLISLSNSVGLDPSKLKFTWAPTSSREEIAAKATYNPQHVEFMETLEQSTGIIQDKTRFPPDLDKEKVKWREEFGYEQGTKLAEWVTAAMEDYRYLQHNKFVG